MNKTILYIIMLVVLVRNNRNLDKECKDLITDEVTLVDSNRQGKYIK